MLTINIKFTQINLNWFKYTTTHPEWRIGKNLHVHIKVTKVYLNFSYKTFKFYHFLLTIQSIHKRQNVLIKNRILFVVAVLIHVNTRSRLKVGKLENQTNSLDNRRDGKGPAPLSANYLSLKRWGFWASDILFSWEWWTVELSSSHCSVIGGER